MPSSPDEWWQHQLPPLPEGTTPYKDVVPSGSKITKVVVYADDVVDSIQIFYDGDQQMPKRGGNGGIRYELNLDIANGEHIRNASVEYGEYFGMTHISRLTLISSKDGDHTFGNARYIDTSAGGGGGGDGQEGDYYEIAGFSVTSGVHSDGTEFLTSFAAYFRKRNS